VSGLLGPPLVGAAIDAFGHRVAFACTALMLAGVLAGCRRFAFDVHLPPPATQDVRLIEPPVDASPPVDPGDALAAVHRDAPRESTFALLGDARLRRLIAASLLASAAWDTFQFALPVHAPTLGLSAASVGLAIASFSAGSLAVRLVLPRVISRMTPTRWVRLALAICVAAYAAIPFASNLALLMVLAFLVGVGPGIAQPLLMTAMHGASPPGRVGEASGLRLTLVSAMQLAVPIGLGLLATVAGSALLFWLYAAVAAAAGIALARAHGRGGGRDQSSNGRPT
jgi:predicted MFS family arabinose efflux permease